MEAVITKLMENNDNSKTTKGEESSTSEERKEDKETPTRADNNPGFKQTSGPPQDDEIQSRKTFWEVK